MLRDLPLKPVYRSDTEDLLTDFYIPALRESVRYDRAVGFFSAGMISIAAQGLSALVECGGNMRLIIGGELVEADFHAIEDGYQLRAASEKIGAEIIRVIDNVEDALFYRRVEALSWMIAAGKLDVKIALRRRGMYHEKLGILSDLSGDKVVFVGSANETPSALLPDFNFESISVFESWKPELGGYCAPFVAAFERLWENRTTNTRVIDFPEAAKQRLISIAKTARVPSAKIEAQLWQKLNSRYQVSEAESPVSRPHIPTVIGEQPFELFQHQRKALDSWRASDFQGIMSLATGTGKTVTAIYGAVKIFELMKRLFLVIAVPYVNLGDQWCEVLGEFGISPIRCYSAKSVWQDRLSECVTLFQTRALDFVCAVVANKTLQSKDFLLLLREIPGDYLAFIGDECHHHTAAGLNAALPAQARIRLGLSATPLHYANDEANKQLIKYYGPVVYEYGLREALQDKILSPYRYHVVLVDLTEDETDQYINLSKQIAVLVAQRGGGEIDPEGDSDLNLLLFKRARLLGSASNKLAELGKLLLGCAPQPLTLFYCGDGSVESEDSAEPIRQIECVSKILHDMGWTNSHFTSRESRAERQGTLNQFRLGFIDALVAIRCLDEGIDIPACRTAYILASSRNPRQSVQRRGRLLRKSPNKEFSEIFDFLVTLPRGTEDSTLERNLFRAELKRVAEFARLSENSAEIVKQLSPLLTEFDLQHELV